jgi:hypothetical protein
MRGLQQKSDDLVHSHKKLFFKHLQLAVIAFGMLHENGTDRVVEAQSRAWKLRGATGLSIFQRSEGGSLVSLSSEQF